MRTLGLAVAVLVVCGLGTGAEVKGDKAAKLVGNWEAAKADKGTLPPGSVVSFAKGGKMKVTHKKDGKEETAEGTYKVDGDKLSIALKHDGKEHKMTLTIKKATDDALTVTDDKDRTVEFKRKK